MALQISWTIEGEKQLSRRLRGIGKEMGDWRPAFKKASENLKRIFSNEVFATQGRVIQERWAPLSRAYALRKVQRFGNRGTLVASGKMQRSFKSQFNADSARVWNAVAYFQYHQSNQPRSRIPRRIMMKLGVDQREMVVKVFHTQFIKKIKKAR